MAYSSVIEIFQRVFLVGIDLSPCKLEIQGVRLANQLFVH